MKQWWEYNSGFVIMIGIAAVIMGGFLAFLVHYEAERRARFDDCIARGNEPSWCWEMVP